MLLLLADAFFAGEGDIGPDRNRFPYSANELRAGCRPGRASKILTRVVDSDGRTETHELFRCVRADDTGAMFEYQRLDNDGRPVGAPRRERKTWAAFATELGRREKHVRMVEKRTITRTGTFDCRVYVVTVSATKNIRYYFAKNLPGPAVQVEVQEGRKRVRYVEMTCHRDGDEAKLIRLLGAKGIASASAKRRAKLEAVFVGIASGFALRPLNRASRNAQSDDAISPGTLEMAYPPSGAGTGALFRAMDRDRDGKVTKDEYLEHHILPGEASAAHKRLDKNGNDYVSKSEFLDRCGALKPDDASRTFRRMDRNGDGALNGSEFIQAWVAWWR